MKIRNRILVPIITSVAVVSLVAFVSLDYMFYAETDRNRIDTTVAKLTDIQQKERQVAERCLVLASLFSQAPKVQAAYAIAHQGSMEDADDPRSAEARELLRTEFTPFADGYAAATDGRPFNLHFHLPTGRSLLRLWKSDQTTSDDISDFRQTIVDINDGDHDPIVGIEVGRGGFAIRGIAPVTGPAGEHLGSVEVLSDYLPVIMTAQDREEDDIAVYMNAKLAPVATKLNDREKYPLLDERHIRVMTSNAELTDALIDAEILDLSATEQVIQRVGSYQIAISPVLDYRGENIGAVVVATDLTSMLNRYAQFRWLLAGGIGLLLVILTIIACYVSHSISYPLGQTVELLKDIAQGEGDLTKRLDDSSQDEIGELSRWFNTFIAKLQGIVAELSLNTHTLASSSAVLSDTATQLASGAEETTHQSSDVAAASEQMSMTMSSMAAASDEMTMKIRYVASATEEMTTCIAEIAKNAADASTVAGEAANLAHASDVTITELGEAATDIGKVIQVIQEIAEQTNLLALNATIEAARAGEAGKGFAVVASEVKDLAKQTAIATEEIRAKILGIQGSSDNAVESIQQITGVVRRVHEISRTIASAVEEQNVTTREIATNISQTSNATESIATGIAQSAQASGEISRNINGVSRSNLQTSQGAQQTRTAGRELSDLAANLRALVGQFKI
ncbi:methyl-accepting chemotaxis protein [Blastopirellula sp. JC732]|uniref:Methyl-accepting chemotaxis protein n=1 Tax=Blastopirellula sediminis TaxID=2894196 RepID=A0A9X1MLK2_9BACT|nr:methyl-accepting chemotaxis protein [Blastopirellula sediminis]MCC9608733.1 methyl-accepting chemotaxis protein [Blastopirellula sediminis]MCC9628490.1 methyl-accepting chemotaxis protein [Blastopirellula sediminis]